MGNYSTTKLHITAIFILLFVSTELLAVSVNPVGGHYRWRNDDGDKVTATFAAAEDQKGMSSNGDILRLRWEIFDSSNDTEAGSETVNTIIEFQSIDSMEFTLLTTMSSPLRIGNSTNVDGGDNTTNDFLTNTQSRDSNVGVIIDGADAQDVSWSETTNTTREFEYTIEVVDNPPMGTIYEFRFPDNGPSEDVPTLQVGLPLPVELVVFGLQKENRTVGLYWQTATETNNDFFEIERLHSNSQEWHSLGQLDGSGTTNEGNRYGFVDNKPQSGYNYYRLKQVDFDGTETYSRTLSANVAFEAGVVKLFPNPAREEISMSFSSPATGQSTVVLYDMMGKTLLDIKIEVEEGENTINFDLSTVPTGVYLAVMHIGGVRFQEKIEVF